MNPNRESENDPFSEFDAFHDALAPARHNRQDWLGDLHSQEPDSRDHDLASELSPNLLVSAEPSWWDRMTGHSNDGAPTSQRLFRLWQARRGDFYLLLSIIILIAVIQQTIGVHGLMTQSSWVSQKLHRTAADLGVIGKTQTVEAAQPEVRVWVDFPSGVYYCPGSRKYGKTPNGQFTTEGNARISQYEPATHKACR